MTQKSDIDLELLELTSPRIKKPQRVSASRFGMVSSQHYHATEAGVEMLAAAGNAVDAAVAAALALGVCEPSASGLGGQTMMLIHLARFRRTIALDGSSRAPHRATPGSVSKEGRRRGYRATTVPGTPRTLAYALKQYGTLPWAQVLQPAIRLAQVGIKTTELQRALQRRAYRHLVEGTAANSFLKTAEGRTGWGSGFDSPCWLRRSNGWQERAWKTSTPAELHILFTATWCVSRDLSAKMT
ncbi:MAG: gamma-glutamyltransferase [Candidatus Zixiibacteriota bacterium]|nr:MAG: gamma-glutamyltransferase [candidate division Zixibacteria bacterium]